MEEELDPETMAMEKIRHRASSLRMKGAIIDFEEDVASGNWYLVIEVYPDTDIESIKEEMLLALDDVEFAGQENTAASDTLKYKFCVYDIE